MKTPLVQIRGKIKTHMEIITGNEPYNNGYKSALVDIMYLIDESIADEKKVIEAAYNRGYRDGADDNGNATIYLD